MNHVTEILSYYLLHISEFYLYLFITFILLRFYDALPGTVWLVNATNYGHGDVLDEFYYDAMDVRLNIFNIFSMKYFQVHPFLRHGQHSGQGDLQTVHSWPGRVLSICGDQQAV